MKYWFGLWLLIYPFTIMGQTLPENAKKYLPVLKEVVTQKWPGAKPYSVFAGQVEQESCISLKNSKCWNPRAELKTSRENGIGFGQLTVAYNKDGTERFNTFKDVQRLDKDLKGWSWEERWDSRRQLIALIALDKAMEAKLPKSIPWESMNRMAFVLAAYNGGAGGILNDRRLCVEKPDCDPNTWFGNVELYSFKQKIKIQGYGKNFFEINREYPRLILLQRRTKYIPLMD